MVWVYDFGFIFMRRGRLRLLRVVNLKLFYNLYNIIKWLNYVWSIFLNKDICIIIKWFFMFLYLSLILYCLI